jgi:recombination protein RecA
MISTGIPKLDSLLSGGVHLNRATQFSGRYSVGKTNIALQIIANAQKQGLDTLWLDSESRFPFEHAERLGVNLDDLELSENKHAEDLFDTAEEWVQKHKGVVVLDSVGGLLSKKEAEMKSGEEGFPIAPRLIPGFLRRITNLLPIKGSALVLLNHEKIDFATGAIKILGGKAVEFHVDQWIRLRQLTGKKIMQGEKRIGDVIEASVQKGPKKGEVAELHLLAGVGFHIEADLIQEAIEKGVIIQKGPFYSFGELRFKGQAALREALRDEQLLQDLKQSLSSDITNPQGDT